MIGRFTQEDTYRGDGLNLYAYCGNNPVMYYDPSGYKGTCPPPNQAESDEQNIFGAGDISNGSEKTWKGTEVIDGEVVLVDVGAFGEDVAQDILAENGWTDFQYIKNNSDNGIDIVARGPQEQLGFFEVKTSTTGQIPNLSDRQANMNYFVDDVLSNAANGTGRYINIDEATQNAVREIYNEFLENPMNVSGNVFGIDLQSGNVYVSRWERG